MRSQILPLKQVACPVSFAVLEKNEIKPWLREQWCIPPEQARRIAEKVEWHYTPKHGSWLNVAEIELSVLQRQALGDRRESQEQMARVTGTWEEDRNERGVAVKWRFTTADARIKLHRLYPSLQ